MRNRALKRRLVATFDAQKFYNRHNFSDIIAKDTNYDLKYILALFNSSLLNYWFSRQFDNLHINPSYFRQLPIFPAYTTTQQALVVLVDEILAKHASLNISRSQGYLIREQRNGDIFIEVPYDLLLQELHAADQWYPTVTLFDAAAIGMFSIPATCDPQTPISSNIYIPTKYPTHLVLRHNKLWLDVPNDNVRRYLLAYLKHSGWQGKTWDEIKNTALIPENEEALHALFVAEAQKKHAITTLLHEIKRIDTQIDEQILDLYGILNETDRQRILGSAPIEEEDDASIMGEDDVPIS